MLRQRTGEIERLLDAGVRSRVTGPSGTAAMSVAS